MSNGNYLTNDTLENVNGRENLRKLHSMATQDEIELGIGFYADAYNRSVELSVDYDVPVYRTSAVIAALSPRMAWSSNVESARDVIAYYVAANYVPSISDYTKFGGAMALQRTRHTPHGTAVIADDPRLTLSSSATKANVIKSLWILQGYDVLSGIKVTSFYANILLASHDIIPENDTEIERLTGINASVWRNAVTVDSHAIQAWRNVSERGTYNASDSVKKIIRADYRAVARELGILPYELQAIVWHTQKRLSGSTR